MGAVGFFGFAWVSGWNSALNMLLARALQRGRHLRADRGAAVRADGPHRQRDRYRPRALRHRADLAAAPARRAGHGHGGGLRRLRRHQRLQRRHGRHHDHRGAAADAQAGLRPEARNRLGGRRRHARHPHPAERDLPDLRLPHRAVDRQAVPRRHPARHPADACCSSSPSPSSPGATPGWRRRRRRARRIAERVLAPARRVGRGRAVRAGDRRHVRRRLHGHRGRRRRRLRHACCWRCCAAG